MNRLFVVLTIVLLMDSFVVNGQNETITTDTIPENIYSGLKFRSLSPAFVSGRISDFAVNPENNSEYYVSVAAGQIWKTTNNGTTFSPIFDKYDSYSVGCLAMDPNNSKVVWAGTGENNHQRSVSYGDGVYKTVDGGKSWKNMGLKKSMHIGMIQIDPRNSDVVYVAAEGSVWGPGEERGLYKTSDGGENWKKILNVSENTGINNVFLSPDNGDIIYATSEQRRRRTQIRIGGGPETNIYKSTDAGKNWKKLTNGIPEVDKGGIGMAISPVDPNIVYAMVEAAMGKGGFFRSDDRGESWNKMSDYYTSGQYYTEIYCDPVDVNTVYSTETRSKYSTDGGKTWKLIGNNHRHVDDHALWIDPKDTDHFMIGGDGGVYETFDKGANYIHKTNLPVTQFYRVNVDNAEPFYFVYGGTQDNSSLGGPSSTLYSDGITKGEWVITLGGDGFWQAVDPLDPNIVYSEYQYGNVYIHDKKSGETTNIKPRERKGEETYKWNWNTPLILSRHLNTRLYIAANKVFQSDDRGQSWKVISADITTGIDRNHWPVMDRYWGVDAVAKNVSTSLYGMAVSLEESPLKEDLLYVGTDDGLIQVTEDGGANWRKIEHFPGVPEFTYVSDILASKHDKNVVFATFDNRKHNDFTPYILKSTDKGVSWHSIAGDLPDKGSVHTVQQDHVNPDLLFAGTEFGIFFSIDGGGQWIKMKSGIPTTSVRDIAIQERENDLVLATFGRGFYILDNYSPLRYLNNEILDQKGFLFPVKEALMYTKRSRGGYGFGSMEYKSKNRDYGAIFSYYIKEIPKTLRQQRREKEKELIKEKAVIPIPTMDELRMEEKEIKPYLIFTVMDENGGVVRKFNKSPSKGISRVSWNMKYASARPFLGKTDKFDPLKNDPDGMPVMPGKYSVMLDMYHADSIISLAGPVDFVIRALNNVSLPAINRRELVAFQQKTDELTRVVRGAERLTDELTKKIIQIRQTVHVNPGVDKYLSQLIADVERELDAIKWTFRGEVPKASPEERRPAQVTIDDRLNSILSVHGRSTSGVNQAQKDVFAILEVELPPLLQKLDKIANKDIPEIELMLDSINAPWTPGRVPKWKK